MKLIFIPLDNKGVGKAYRFCAFHPFRANFTTFPEKKRLEQNTYTVDNKTNNVYSGVGFRPFFKAIVFTGYTEYTHFERGIYSSGKLIKRDNVRI